MIAQFALRLIVGMSLMWLLMPRRDVTSGFFRIQMLVTLGLAVLAALTAGMDSGETIAKSLIALPSLTRWLCVGVAVASFAGSVMWTLERRVFGMVWGIAVFGQSVAALLLAAPMPESFTGSSWLLGLSEFSAATMVGGFVAAMLLGHWYLTAPTMTIRPLSRLNLFLAAFCGLRLLLSVVAMGIESGLLETQTHWLWLTLRWVAGIIGPGILIFMVHRILRYRNTQSATGVLFTGVILTFIGELSATLLMRELGLPF